MTLDLPPDQAHALARFRRGRPRSLNPRHDTGTPELVMKRLRGDTGEALDLCLERGLITREQHWCGIHLRWLYTLRYGAPGLRAVDPTHIGGLDIKVDDSHWRAAREREYHDALLAMGRQAPLVVNLCVYNERPIFLLSPHPDALNELTRLRHALDLLAKHWGR